ncbi:MAG: multiheme c-type cytochrome [Leptospiraceae bacterium]
MSPWRIPLLSLVILALSTGILLLASPARQTVAPRLSGAQIYGKIQGLGPGCAGCHLSVKLGLDGPAASGLSKGIHPVRKKLLEHPFFELDSRECTGCHTKVHKSWNDSAHGQSFSNPIFQHAFKRDKKAWCLNCHAPLWEPDSMDPEQIARDPDFRALYAQGINCATCHIRNGAIVGPTNFSGREEELFHPVTYDPGLGRETFCAGCHQFNFVDKLEPFVVYANDMAMQNTVAEFTEHRKTLPSNLKKQCVDCHFSPEHQLKTAIQTSSTPEIELTLKLERLYQKTEKTNNYRLTWSIQMNNLGHHYPTGDLFRILTLYAYDSSGNEVYRYDFRKEVRVIDRALVRDTTLKPEAGSMIARRNSEVFLSVPAKRCELVYRLQGSIEPKIHSEFETGVLRKTLYSGPCKK